MPNKLVIAPEAAVDLADAFDWYEERRPGLGEEFLSCVDASLQQICRIPEMYPTVLHDYRRGLVRRFPYAVFYEYTVSTIVVYAIFHTSMNPQKWRDRMP
ncbi:MAG: type II toxin-antitoxin system RelE/ParE family toxin [Planctomycetes bacterium]|nr:type II toxin-antitoxin system RelE/ParE family toxin [Planctomycetota bacterium]